jgi:hypothetical protein
VIRGRLVVHAHFYQPSRVDPFSGRIPREPAAAPYHDWNGRIDAECYRPNAERGNLDHISFDLGPTLASWLQASDPDTYRGFLAADRPTDADGAAPAAAAPASGHPSLAPAGNAMAQAFHHSILPLASFADRRTEILWGIQDFEVRFGHRPRGLWLPETAVDLPTLRLLAEHGIAYTVLAPWQAADPSLDTRRLYRVEVGGGRSIGVAFYDGALSAAVSFDPSATADADGFMRDRLIPRFGLPAAEQEALRAAPTPASAASDRATRGSAASAGSGSSVASDPPVIVIASDGELYGHHQKFRDLFLHRLVVGPNGDPTTLPPNRGFDVVVLADQFAPDALAALPVARIAERTSWSCHHGVARWSAECPDAADGRWKGPLRAALDRLSAAIDATATDLLRREARSVDLWEARDAYIEVVAGTTSREAFAVGQLRHHASAATTARFLDLMEAERWRLAMFQSDAWFWDDPVRFETKQVLRAAARAVRLTDEVAGTRLEAAFIGDLSLFTSPSRGIDGLAIYREALAEVNQPAP